MGTGPFSRSFIFYHDRGFNIVEVESFTLGNNKVIAPYVRLISNNYEKRRYRFEFRYSLFTIGDFKRYFEVSIALVIFVSGKK